VDKEVTMVGEETEVVEVEVVEGVGAEEEDHDIGRDECEWSAQMAVLHNHASL
jgi:hypothetical protein